MNRLIIQLVCIVVVALAIPIASAGPLADYGDAADNNGTIGAVLAYPGVDGRFPSLFDTVNVRIPGRRGAFHLNTNEEWLNLQTISTTTTETDALIIDNDVDENLSGIVIVQAWLSAYIVAAVGVSASAPDVPRYLNVLIDQNRDGEWKDTSFGKEWVAVNQLVGTKPNKTEVIVSKGFILNSTQNMWMRVTLTRTKIDPSEFSSVGGWDGSAPAGGFGFGETEDINTTPVIVFKIGGKAIPVFGTVVAFTGPWLLIGNKWTRPFSITAPPLAVPPQKFVKVVINKCWPRLEDLEMSAPVQGIGPIPMNDDGFLTIQNVANELGVKSPPAVLPFIFTAFLDNPPRAKQHGCSIKVYTDPEDIDVSSYDEMEFEFSAPPTIESSDTSGTKKDVFEIGETVYGTGNGYSPNSFFDVFVVPDTTFIDGMPIPSRVLSTEPKIATDGDGAISPSPKPLWSSAEIGKYDIVVDVNHDGIYNADIDALDDLDVGDAGFQTIPEFPTIVLPVAAVIGMMFLIYRRRSA